MPAASRTCWVTSRMLRRTSERAVQECRRVWQLADRQVRLERRPQGLVARRADRRADRRVWLATDDKIGGATGGRQASTAEQASMHLRRGLAAQRAARRVYLRAGAGKFGTPTTRLGRRDGHADWHGYRVPQAVPAATVPAAYDLQAADYSPRQGNRHADDPGDQFTQPGQFGGTGMGKMPAGGGIPQAAAWHDGKISILPGDQYRRAFFIMNW